VGAFHFDKLLTPMGVSDFQDSIKKSLEFGGDFISHSPEDTQCLGRRLGEKAEAGDIFLLVGSLGAGKTCLTQGIAWGLGVEGYISSPSFVVVKEHQGRLSLYHIDLYRLNKIEEILELGLDSYFYDGGVCVVEWAQRGMGALPQEHLLIRLDYLSETERSFRLEPNGERYLSLVSELCRQ
jgi:tRNA threonylcarbamoyladenosine biosynthesis protein TsaE